jgi:hypothetical protein
MNTGNTKIKVVPVKLLLKGNEWNINKDNSVLFDSSGILFERFNFNNLNQQVDVFGLVSKKPAGKLQFTFKDFESDQLNDLLSLFDVQIGGKVNGTAQLGGILDKPVLNSDLHVDHLSWFADTLGDAQLNTNWNSTQGFVDVDANVTRGGDKNIQVKGKYLFKKEGDELDFNINLQKTYVQSFAHYLKGIFSDIGGIASAKLKLSGPVKKPQLTGKAYLQKVSFTVDYLKTNYNFSTEVQLDNNLISFNDIVVNDARGNQSLVSGKITHDHLNDFNLDIDIIAKNAQVLNTAISDNELFYGKAYASGTIKISGFLDYIKMKIGLKSEKGTKIFIPLSNPEEIGKSSFISFIVTDSTQRAKVKDDAAPDFSGVDLYMDFDITPDADVSLIFDSKIGDVIEGNGRGNLTMMVSPSEDFKMFGNYEIEKGKYLFTLQNIINKPFIIEKGGYIRWNGDPYDAYVNIDATYKLNTSLYNLTLDSSFRKLVPVELNLHLTDKLFTPNIAFDINVQNIDPTVETQVKRYINTEEEKYRQAVALLVTRGFTSPSELSNRAPVSSGAVVGTNAYELLSNQLSNWASQISQQVNVGVNYNPGSVLSPEELKVALSTSILNDKVTIDGNVGYSNSITSNNQNTSSLVGDFNVEVKASKDGRIRLKAFNRSNNNSLINNINSPYTQGVGVFYREEFNSFSELTRRFRNWFKRNNAAAVETHK